MWGVSVPFQPKMLWRTGVPSTGGLALSWLMLAALAMMWAAFLLPNRKNSPSNSVKDFERDMDLLADTEGQGRWIVTPKKGMAFIGPRARAQARARERRRRVFVFLLESIALSFLIGLAPPLRAIWIGTGILVVILGLYSWMLISIRDRGSIHPMPVAGRAPMPVRPATTIPVSDLDEEVVVRPAREVGAVRV
jgi:hypothetical protein